MKILDEQDYNDLLDELIKKSQKDERIKFKKEFKLIKKQIINSAKHFQCWDYDFLLEIIEHCLHGMYLYLGNKYLVPCKTETDNEDYKGNWSTYTAKLNECYMLLKNRNNDDVNSIENIKKAFNIMIKYMRYWWS